MNFKQVLCYAFSVVIVLVSTVGIVNARDFTGFSLQAEIQFPVNPQTNTVEAPIVALSVDPAYDGVVPFIGRALWSEKAGIGSLEKTFSMTISPGVFALDQALNRSKVSIPLRNFCQQGVVGWIEVHFYVREPDSTWTLWVPPDLVEPGSGFDIASETVDNWERRWVILNCAHKQS